MMIYPSYSPSGWARWRGRSRRSILYACIRRLGAAAPVPSGLPHCLPGKRRIKGPVRCHLAQIHRRALRVLRPAHQAPPTPLSRLPLSAQDLPRHPRFVLSSLLADRRSSPCLAGAGAQSDGAAAPRQLCRRRGRCRRRTRAARSPRSRRTSGAAAASCLRSR